VPTADESKLISAEVYKLSFKMGLHHAKKDILKIYSSILTLDIKEFEPKGHHFVVEVRTWLYKLHA
jgi:hypothetical protein